VESGSGIKWTPYPDPRLFRNREKYLQIHNTVIDDHLLNSEEEVLPVLLRDGGEVGVGAGQVASLPAAQVPAVLHHPDDKVIANLLYRVNHTQSHLHTLPEQSFLRGNQPRWLIKIRNIFSNPKFVRPDVNFFHLPKYSFIKLIKISTLPLF
jgi:hypothetical protein